MFFVWLRLVSEKNRENQFGQKWQIGHIYQKLKNGQKGWEVSEILPGKYWKAQNKNPT